MEFPEDLLYHSEHLWVREEDNGLVTVGISDYAQEQLGKVIYVDLPEEGDSLEADDEMGGVESAKSVSDLICPVSGEVVEINQDLTDNPGLLNEEPYSGGWLAVIKLDNGLPEDLMSADEYVAGLDLVD